jgi:Tol biopolymer transport system component
MSSVGFCTAPSFSPDGGSIAFLSNLTGLPQVFVVPTDGGWPVQVTSGSDPVGSAAWSPKGDLLCPVVPHAPRTAMSAGSHREHLLAR